MGPGFDSRPTHFLRICNTAVMIFCYSLVEPTDFGYLADHLSSYHQYLRTRDYCILKKAVDWTNDYNSKGVTITISTRLRGSSVASHAYFFWNIHVPIVNWILFALFTEISTNDWGPMASGSGFSHICCRFMLTQLDRCCCREYDGILHSA